MISDEEIRQIYADTTGFDTESGHGSDIAINDFARATYNLGLQQQRESDADVLLAQDVDPSFKRRLAEVIRNNTGELK